MATIGTLKGTRTRAKNSLYKAIAGIRGILDHRANIGGMGRAQLEDLLHITSSKILDVRMKMERLEAANDKLSDAYAADEVLHAEFQTLLDGEANLMDATATAINDMEALKIIIERKLAQVAVPGAKAEARQEGGFEDRVTEILARLTVAQNGHGGANGQGGQGANHHGVPVTIKLPKMEIEKFGSDIVKWTGFWAQFNSAVHGNANLAVIDKFNYLKAYLDSEALNTISGLQLTAENYTVAVNLLQERFGKNKLIIAAHYNELNDLPTPSNSTAKIRTLRCTGTKSTVSNGTGREH